ncbi:MAG: hypothetical protein HYX72_00160 [Acidobacteria bacterium]|nr:hypothetical protein [Acidobacteriota bacterium]
MAIDLVKAGKGLEAAEKLHNLYTDILQLNINFTSVLDENRRLKEELADKARLKEIETDLEFADDGHFLVRKSEQGEAVRPYCPTCWAIDQKLVHMSRHKLPGTFQCAVHEPVYYTKVYEDWKRRQDEQRRQQRNQSRSNYPVGPWS